LISYHLKQPGREHIILEKADRVAEAWLNRWDSFTLITPNWMSRLPGAENQDDHLDDFMIRDDVIAYFEKYVEQFELPIKYGYRVEITLRVAGESRRGALHLINQLSNRLMIREKYTSP